MRFADFLPDAATRRVGKQGALSRPGYQAISFMRATASISDTRRTNHNSERRLLTGGGISDCCTGAEAIFVRCLPRFCLAV
jgi:hypothetical protein